MNLIILNYTSIDIRHLPSNACFFSLCNLPELQNIYLDSAFSEITIQIQEVADQQLLNKKEFIQFRRILQSNGKLVLKFNNYADGAEWLEDKGLILKYIKLTGFLNIEEKAELSTYIVSATKVIYKSREIIKNTNTKSNISFPRPPPTYNPWENLGPCTELIDEVTLRRQIKPFISSGNQLKFENTIKYPNRPCADCTCGLAEKLQNEEKGTIKSNCNRCYLGDAFRCGNCPHRGKPPFAAPDTIIPITTKEESVKVTNIFENIQEEVETPIITTHNNIVKIL